MTREISHMVYDFNSVTFRETVNPGITLYGFQRCLLRYTSMEIIALKIARVTPGKFGKQP